MLFFRTTFLVAALAFATPGLSSAVAVDISARDALELPVLKRQSPSNSTCANSTVSSNWNATHSQILEIFEQISQYIILLPYYLRSWIFSQPYLLKLMSLRLIAPPIAPKLLLLNSQTSSKFSFRLEVVMGHVAAVAVARIRLKLTIISHEMWCTSEYLLTLVIQMKPVCSGAHGIDKCFVTKYGIMTTPDQAISWHT